MTFTSDLSVLKTLKFWLQTRQIGILNEKIPFVTVLEILLFTDGSSEWQMKVAQVYRLVFSYFALAGRVPNLAFFNHDNILCLEPTMRNEHGFYTSLYTALGWSRAPDCKNVFMDLDEHNFIKDRVDVYEILLSAMCEKDDNGDIPVSMTRKRRLVHVLNMYTKERDEKLYVFRTPSRIICAEVLKQLFFEEYLEDTQDQFLDVPVWFNQKTSQLMSDKEYLDAVVLIDKSEISVVSHPSWTSGVQVNTSQMTLQTTTAALSQADKKDMLALCVGAEVMYLLGNIPATSA